MVAGGRATMRTLLLSILALGTLLGGTRVAPPGFFDGSAAPGTHTITVVQNTTVRNERVTLQTDGTFDDCIVDITDGVSLSLLNVMLSVVNDKRLVFQGEDTSSLFIMNTSINACD